MIKILIIISLLSGFNVYAFTLELSPEADNTLFEDVNGQISNGSGPHLFAGKIRNGQLRRALIRFDVSQIPVNAEIETVSLRMHMSRTISATQTFELFPLLDSWGEAGSNSGSPGGQGASAEPGDATWLHGHFDTQFWQIPGGDFSAQASASALIDDVGDYSWSSDQMRLDVEAWRENQLENNGWILKGVEFLGETAKRFDSKENADQSVRPVLLIEYNLPIYTIPTLGFLQLIVLVFAIFLVLMIKRKFWLRN